MPPCGKLPKHIIEGAYCRQKLPIQASSPMSAADQNCEGLPSFDQIRVLLSLSPLIGFGQRFVAEPDIYKRTVIVSEALEWCASQTKVEMDDKVVGLVAAVLKTPEGEALVRGLVVLGESFLAAKG